MNRCIDCEDSCDELCAYQSSCIQCPSDQYLDLDTLQCVNQCDDASQILINDEQVGNWSVCRSFEYYVNPDSSSVVELGTREHPYKSLGYVFVELLNYHSHSNRNITVNIMEGTTNYLMIGNNYIVNITQVTIQPYSDNMLTEPGKASIVGLDNGVLEFTAGTSYNLLQSLELKVTEMIYDNNQITESEKTTLIVEKILVTVQRSNFTMHNMNLYSNYSDVYDDNYFIWGLYIQNRLISIHDLHVNISGIIFKTFDPLNMNIQNIDIDYYKTLGGIRMDSK